MTRARVAPLLVRSGWLMSARLRPWLLSLVALSACEVPRPEGAYEPTPFEDYASEKMATSRDAGPRTPPTIARPRDAGEGAPPPSVSADSGAQVSTESSELDALAGVYVMRLDHYSTLEVRNPPLLVQNRVSNLMLVDVRRGAGNTLVASELICDQVYAHRCDEGCTTWETSLDSAVYKKLDQVKPVERELLYDPMTRTLTGKEARLALGFEDNGSDALPVDKADQRVWQLGSGVAMLSSIHARIKVGMIATNVDCGLASVQRFRSSFSGKLQAAGLDGAMFTPELEYEVKDVEVIGPRTQCDATKVSSEDLIDKRKVLRFKKVDVEQCPDAAAFERLLPGDPP